LRYVKETLEYDELQISRILHQAFKLARKRKKLLHNIHKSNVLKSSVLWNEILDEVAVGYPDVEVIHQLVDSAATNLCLKPTQFDVMVMENMFGDILSDQGGGILGSLGLMPSACLGDDKAYYEPSHGSAPDIAGKNIANPYSMIGSVAMMLENSFDMAEEAKNVWAAMQGVFADGYSTADLSKPGSGVIMKRRGLFVQSDVVGKITGFAFALMIVFYTLEVPALMTYKSAVDFIVTVLVVVSFLNYLAVFLRRMVRFRLPGEESQ
jgi:3-isopropylmalate dehydrogenase